MKYLGTKSNGADVATQSDIPVGGGSGVASGTATVDFTSFAREASVAVTGQTSILSTSKITATIYCNTDDVYAQDWDAVVIRSIVAATGFTITLRPAIGTFKGPVSVNWTWS